MYVTNKNLESWISHINFPTVNLWWFVFPILQVSTTLENCWSCRARIPSMGHHTWLYVTSLSISFTFTILWVWKAVDCWLVSLYVSHLVKEGIKKKLLLVANCCFVFFLCWQSFLYWVSLSLSGYILHACWVQKTVDVLSSLIYFVSNSSVAIMKYYY